MHPTLLHSLESNQLHEENMKISPTNQLEARETY